MRSLRSLVAITLIAVVRLTQCSPVPVNATSLDRRWDYGRINQYLGIYWVTAVQECTTDQLNILEEATRVAEEFLNFPWSNQDFVGEGSGAWEFYFGSGKNNARNWHNDLSNQKSYINIINNLNQARRYPYYGKQGQYKQSKQVTYRCKEDPYINKCANGRVAAYTSPPNLQSSGTWAITFCPFFFNSGGTIDYLNNRMTEYADTSPNNLYRLVSYEQLLAHEFMHVGQFGMAQTPQDVVSYRLPGLEGEEVKVYGWERTHSFANLYTKKIPSSINWETSINADNYAWFLTAYWFEKHFNWVVDPNTDKWVLYPRIRRRSLASISPRQDYAVTSGDPTGNDPSGDDTINADNLVPTSQPAPLNCNEPALGDTNPQCSYVGDDYTGYYQEYYVGGTNPGPGCTLSRECQNPVGNAVNPACTCICNGEPLPLTDYHCQGFQGSAGNPPPAV